MKWEVALVQKGPGMKPAPITVDAANWLDALKGSLARMGEPKENAKRFACSVRDNSNIFATDLVSKRAFHLRVVDAELVSAPLPEADGVSFLESKKAAPKEPEIKSYIAEAHADVPPSPPAMPPHVIFFRKDGNPAARGDIAMRERLIEVDRGLGMDGINMLLQYYFETLRREVEQFGGNGKSVNLAIYDYEFKDRPVEPAIAVLIFQDWKGGAPVIAYPREEAMTAAAAAVVPAPRQPRRPSVPPAKAPAVQIAAPAEISFAAPAARKEPPAPAKQQAVAAKLSRAQQAVNAALAQPSAAPSKATPAPQGARAPQQPARLSASPARAAVQVAAPAALSFGAPAAPAKEMGFSRAPGPDEPDENKVLAEVFEELQDLFITQTQEEAGDLVLTIAVKKIPVEGGTVFLADINSRDMIFAAVSGPTAAKLKGKKLNMKHGIVGFAAREGAAIAITDVSKDPRFCRDFDQEGEFKTRSVLCAPIQYEGRTFGAIELVNRRVSGQFTRGEINVITYLASQLAEYIATSLPSGEPDFIEEEKHSERKPAPRTSRTSVKNKGKGKGR